MIKKLTKKQESKLTEYRDKWIKIGLDTSPCNRKQAEKSMGEAYKMAGLKEPLYIWFQSPLSAMIGKKVIGDLIKNTDEKLGASVGDSVGDSVWGSVRDSVRDSVWDSVWALVGDSVGASVRASVRDSVKASVRDSVKASVRNSVGASVRGSVWDSVRASVLASVRDSVRGSVRDSVWGSVGDSVWGSVRDSVGDFIYGSHDANWLGFYNYFFEVVDLKDCEKLKPLMELSKNSGWVLPYSNMAIMSEKPEVINMKEGVIHCDGGPAIKYRDGFCVWALNGTRVPEYLAITKESVLSLDFFKKESNADVKAEFVRKFGIDRMISLGKKTDSWENYKNGEWWEKSRYELIDMSPIFESIDYAPHIKMINQTVEGLYHLEAVAPECENLEQAMNWREKIRNEKYKTISIK